MTLTAAHFGKLPGFASKKPSKYRAVPTFVDGERFPSKAEAKRWVDLRNLARAGEIRKLRRQVSFPLLMDGRPILIKSDGYPNGRAAKYTADFVYIENEAEVIEEFKGHDTTESRFRRAVFEAQYCVTIRMTKSS